MTTVRGRAAFGLGVFALGLGVMSAVFHRDVERLSARFSRRSSEAEPACTSHADPSPLYRRDATYGYGIAPGRYTFTVCPEDEAVTRTYRWTASIDPDGGRRTGYRDPEAARRIVILGDSWMFGWALNDEQTMSWLLQDYVHGRYAVRNFAQTGGGSTQELIAVRQMADTLGPDDIVVLGYADYYGERNVAAPRRIRAEAGYAAGYAHYRGGDALQHPRASLRDGHVAIDFIPLDCALLAGYCDQPDPSPAGIQAVTLAIYGEIVARLHARIAVMYLSGPDNDPVVEFLKRRPRVAVVDARLERSSFFERDDLPGYDRHPGALANDAFFRRLSAWVDAVDRVDAVPR